MAGFEHLFTPVSIGGLEIKNRTVMAPMTNGYCNTDGSVSDRIVSYYAARAAGGVGLIVVEACLVHPRGLTFENHISCYHDRFIPGLRRLASAIKEQGARAFLQLHHGGRQAKSYLTGQPSLAPSSLRFPDGGEVPQAFTLEGIAETIEAFGEAARRAREAGFDGVELHGAHGYLINQFLSPCANQRGDAYGGSVEKRLRFALEVLERCQAKVGKDYPISCRLSADEFHREGNRLEQSRRIAAALAEAGVAAIHVSAGAFWSDPRIDPRTRIETYAKDGLLLHLAEGVKKAVKVPVIGVGNLLNPAVAEDAIACGRVDLVALGRPLLADPAFVAKVQRREQEAIVPCIICDACQIRPRWPGISCLVNPQLGHEQELAFDLAASPRKVLLLGAGLGGLAAARVAALRGHQVSVWCEDSSLGGLAALRTRVPGTDRFPLAIEYYEHELGKVGVEVKLNQRLGAEAVAESGAEVIVVAAPGKPLVPQVHGLDSSVSALEVLAGKVEVGRRVLVAGAGLLAGEVALFLASQGKEVTVVTPERQLAGDSPPRLWLRLSQALEDSGVRVIREASLARVTGQEVVVRTSAGDTPEEADTLVVAYGFQREHPIVHELRRAQAGDVYVLGDTYDAYEAAALAYEGARIAAQV